ncbi:tail assembly protein [Paracoccus aminovorans]|uniref:tail assembly protein n=1 Tax=Paracoccus aminovorans TaxID=34004 RepID=UPI000781D6CA|nr:tail assembly protein [Paracoccus aminovorans]
MRTIHLYGKLGKEFGSLHRFAVDTVAEAIEALRANFPKFFDAIRHGFYRVVVGKTSRNGMELDEAMLPGFKLGQQDLHIVPVVKGRKRGGIGKIIAGIALIGLSMVTGGMAGTFWTAGILGSTTTAASLMGSSGAGLLISGVASFIAPQQDAPDDTKSFTMTGPTTTTREGGIVPIVYGRVWTGGTMINGSLSIRSEDDPLGSTTEEIFTGLSAT